MSPSVNADCIAAGVHRQGGRPRSATAIDIILPWLYFTIMIKTQIQLPDRLYQEAKRVAQEREMSLAEVLRRGLEYITRVYPPLHETAGQKWQLPEPVSLKLRSGVTLERLRDFTAADAEPALAPASAHRRHRRNA